MFMYPGTWHWAICAQQARKAELFENNNNDNNEELYLIGAVPMVTMTQSAANWRNTHTHVDRTHSLTHWLTSTQLEPHTHTLHTHTYTHTWVRARTHTRTYNICNNPTKLSFTCRCCCDLENRARSLKLVWKMIKVSTWTDKNLPRNYTWQFCLSEAPMSLTLGQGHENKYDSVKLIT